MKENIKIIFHKTWKTICQIFLGTSIGLFWLLCLFILPSFANEYFNSDLIGYSLIYILLFSPLIIYGFLGYRKNPEGFKGASKDFFTGIRSLIIFGGILLIALVLLVIFFFVSIAVFQFLAGLSIVAFLLLMILLVLIFK